MTSLKTFLKLLEVNNNIFQCISFLSTKVQSDNKENHKESLWLTSHAIYKN